MVIGEAAEDGKKSSQRPGQRIQHEHTVPITLQIRNRSGRTGPLPSLANTGALTRKEDMTNIEEELKKAQEILDNNPVLEYSPGGLRRMGRTVEEYLSRWPQADQEKYRNYYEKYRNYYEDELWEVLGSGTIKK